ncbi:hypothetical protein [Paenibacillus rigui]|uniref:hypothetical protein n=1 Tax=Paenibacillus rigui TaxID=554312 RepID=UPI001C52F649|nr:hypothetical protein [Paenibacillus rigui]
MHLIGLDIGTTGIGSVLVDENSGESVQSMIKKSDETKPQSMGRLRQWRETK